MSDAHTFASSITSNQGAAVHKDMSPAERVSALYELHRNEIFRFLVGQGLEPAKAQEAAQDVFVRFFVAITKGTEIVTEQAWLYGVASKVAVDYWRREGRPMWVELDAFPGLGDSLRSPEQDPEAAAMRTARLRRVARSLALLPKEQRLGIHLRLQGLRYKAIAKILGVSVSTTAEWLSIAVERLRSAANE